MRQERPKAPRTTSTALIVRVSGVVQGVGFRPFVDRLAHRHGLKGWVRNAQRGVEIHVEGSTSDIEPFVQDLISEQPQAAHISSIEKSETDAQNFADFSILSSTTKGSPTVRISPDLPVCHACLNELFEPTDLRHRYSYINCTECGPRYSIILGLPYDRKQTTMKNWPMCADCERAYNDPADRRFHAQPVACPRCGPTYDLRQGGRVRATAGAAIELAVKMMREGKILAVKGLGGYHLACDARNAEAVWTLRSRKFRKEKPFALMVAGIENARSLAHLSDASEELLTSVARPIVLAPARVSLPGVAPENSDLGIMLAYTPVHHLLFDCGAPEALVMTSANRSSEPIAYRDEEALEMLDGLADAFLIGHRPIARRVDDSIARVTPFGPVVLRRGRGLAPQAVANLPSQRPILAVGADLKNALTLVIDGQAFAGQHVGDLEHYAAREAFQETIRDLLRMYEVDEEELQVAHDGHPEYASTLYASELPGTRFAVQHHRAHIASVLAEHGALEKRVAGFAFDGTGYGDDGSIWGGEVFVGSVMDGLTRVGHLRPAVLPGGDAAARSPVQAAAGFLDQLNGLPDLTAPPFGFPERYLVAIEMVRKGVRSFPTTSMGRLFDTVAALVGFTRDSTFEGQAAIWLEQVARDSARVAAYPFPKLDFRPLLERIVDDRIHGRPTPEIASAFHRAVVEAILDSGRLLRNEYDVDTIVLSGGVFQNKLLLDLMEELADGTPDPPTIWINRAVPPNDGGISLGQAATVAVM